MKPAPQADILGKLLVVEEAIQALPYETSIAAFLIRALSETPGVGKVGVCLRGVLYPHDPALADACQRFTAIADAPASIGQKELGAVPGSKLIPFTTARHLYGFLALGLDDQSAFAPYAAFIKNIANVVAVNLEARDNFAKLERAKSELETRVAERTAELNEQNTWLTNEIVQRKKVEQTLHETAYETEDLYNNAPCGYQSVDKDGLFVRVNDTELAWLGYTREELIGKKRVFDLWSPATRPTFEKAFLRLKTQGVAIDEELEMVRKDGTMFPVLLAATAVTDSNGNFLRSRGIVHDLTERKRTEATLRQNETNLREAIHYTRSLIEASLDPLVTISPDDKITDVNEATVRATGVARASLVGSDFADYFTEPEKARAGYREVYDKGFVTDYPLALRHVSGAAIDVLYNASLYHDEKGKVAGVFAAARDVTERNKAEREIAQLNLQNKLILDSAGEGIYGLDTDGRCTFVNPAAAQLFGYTAEELIGRNTHATVHHTRADGAPYPQEECPVQAAYKQGAIHRGSDLYWRKDGSSFPVEFISSPILLEGKITGAVVTFRDITELKRSAEQLRAASLYVRSLIEASLDPLVTISAEGKITDVNEATTQATGVPREQLIGSDFSGYFTEPDKARAGYQAVFAKGSVTDYPLALRHVSGKITDVLYNASLYRSEKGDVVGVFAAARDVTELKQAEEQLRQLNAELEQRVQDRTRSLATSEERMRLFFERQLVGMAITSPEKGWVKVNDKTCEMLGYSREELARLTWAEMTYPEDLASDEILFDQMLKGKIDSYTMEKRFVRKNGSIVFTILSVGCVRRPDRSVDYVLAVLEDITERKRAEDSIKELNKELSQRAARIETVNKELESFAYSVSHDLRVPLRAIDGFSRILLEDYREKLDDEGKRLINVVRDNTVRMAKLIDDILAFSRIGRKELERQPVNMTELAKAVVAELAPSWAGRDVKIELGDLPPTHGDAAMLRQVWVNLLSNAVKFTRPKTCAVIDISGHVEEGETAYVIKDNGVGFDMKYADKLFGVFQRLHSAEEFEGTGIGLAIVKCIVIRHGGRVWAEGKVNEEAAFHFTLPKLEKNNG